MRWVLPMVTHICVVVLPTRRSAAVHLAQSVCSVFRKCHVPLKAKQRTGLGTGCKATATGKARRKQAASVFWMNAPDRYEKFVVPEGLKKISYQKDTKVANAATFILQREDHTLGNLIRMQLFRDKAVTFSGYKIPHPLEYKMLIKVQTNGTKTPMQAMEDALNDLQEELRDIKAKFAAEVERNRDPNAMQY